MNRLIQGCSVVIALGAMLWGGWAHASEDVASRLKQTLEQRFPTIRINAVQPSPIAGLYQVIAGDDQVVYTDATGDHVVVGHMMDTQTHQDLSASALDAFYTIDFKSLPLDSAIKIVKGNGERKVALFEDPDCPYCRRLEQSMRSMTNLTVYLFLFPLDQVHPHATADSEAIWCSPDRASAWTNWMLNQTAPPKGGSCANDPIQKIHGLAQSLHVHATPTIFLQNGKRIGGAIPAEQLERLMAEALLPAGPAHLAASKAVPN
jgi:thiol:disulfide interchange protein DsbC